MWKNYWTGVRFSSPPPIIFTVESNKKYKYSKIFWYFGVLIIYVTKILQFDYKSITILKNIDLNKKNIENKFNTKERRELFYEENKSYKLYSYSNDDF